MPIAIGVTGGGRAQQDAQTASELEEGEDPMAGPEDGGAGGGLPADILEAIAVSNAKSIGEQPAILANLALANQIANINLAQQQALTAQQAMLQLTLATVAKCVEVIADIDPSKPNAGDQMKKMMELMEQMTSKVGGAAPPAPPPNRAG
jgi:hypothetical protein